MEFSLNLSCSKRSKLKNSTLVGTIKLRTRGRLENGKRKREERCISFRVSSQRESLEIKQRLDLLPVQARTFRSQFHVRETRNETFLSLYRRVKEEFWMQMLCTRFHNLFFSRNYLYFYNVINYIIKQGIKWGLNFEEFLRFLKHYSFVKKMIKSKCLSFLEQTKTLIPFEISQTQTTLLSL